MHRREFLWTGLSAAALVGTATLEASLASTAELSQRPLRFTPHRRQFPRHTGDSLEAEFEFLASHGFTAIEDRHLAKRTPAEQEQIGALATRYGLQIGPFLALEDYARPILTSGRRSLHRSVLWDIDAVVEVAVRTGAKSCLLAPGRLDPSLPTAVQWNNARCMIEECLARTDSSGLTLLLEPTPIPAAHAPMLITTLHDAIRLCRLVNHPRCQAVCDVYDWFATEKRNSLSDLVSFLQHEPKQIGHIALADFPGRKEPGTGTIDFDSLFRVLKSIGFKGLVGLDHGASQSGLDGETQVLQIYSQHRD